MSRVETTKINKDGLRYKSKEGGTPFGGSSNIGTMNCYKCGLCVSLAERNDLAISTAEMDVARRQFIAGELVLDGIRYAPNPERDAALKRALGQRLKLMRLVPPPLPLKARLT